MLITARSVEGQCRTRLLMTILQKLIWRPPCMGVKARLRCRKSTRRSNASATAASWLTTISEQPCSRHASRSSRTTLPGMVGVERAGRLVGQDELRLFRQGPGDGDALLLPDGHLRREMPKPFPSPTRSNRCFAWPRFGLPLEKVAPEQHVLQRGVALQQVEGLEDVGDMVGAETVALRLPKFPQLLAADVQRDLRWGGAVRR